MDVCGASNQTSAIYEKHSRFMEERISLLDRNILFTPQDINLALFDTYPASPLDSKLLLREVYNSRDKYRELVRRFHLIGQALQVYSTKDLRISNSFTGEAKSFYLPTLVSVGQDIRVPRNTSIIYKSPEEFYIAPGRVIKTKKGDLAWKSFTPEEILAYLENRNNYDVGVPLLNVTPEETLASLESNFITYFRNKIKRQGAQEESIFHLGESEGLPLEEIVSSIYAGNIGEKERQLMYEFPLIHNSVLKKKVKMYLDESTMYCESAVDHIEGESKDKLLLLYPTFASTERTEKHTMEINIELRSLLLNYAFCVKDEMYHDFVGEDKWIVSPISITRSKGEYHGVTEYPLYFFLDLFPSGEEGE